MYLGLLHYQATPLPFVSLVHMYNTDQKDEFGKKMQMYKPVLMTWTT